METAGTPAPARRRDVNLVPFIDVLLILMIFFMITTTFKVAPGIEPQPPPTPPRPRTCESSVMRGRRRIRIRDLRESGEGQDRRAPRPHKAEGELGRSFDAQGHARGRAAHCYQLMISVLDALRRKRKMSDGVSMHEAYRRKP